MLLFHQQINALFTPNRSTNCEPILTTVGGWGLVDLTLWYDLSELLLDVLCGAVL